MLAIQAKKRNIFGKKLKKVYREGDLIPAVMYGPKEEPLSLFISAREFGKVFSEAGETTVVSLEIEGLKDKKDVLIHTVNFDPLKNVPRHVDFYAIEAGKAIEVRVPLVFQGTAPAVKELGGTLVKVLHEVEVKGKPQSIPHEITVDISALKDFDSHITAEQLSLPNGVELLTSPHEVVASVAAPRAEEPEEAETADISQIEVEKKGKKEEEEEGATS